MARDIVLAIWENVEFGGFLVGIKVSLILPSLNVAKYIRKCLDSVRGQTLREIEVLCIDAGSDDGTREILQEYADADKRIMLIDSPRRSYGYQVNLGIQLAHGEYIGIVETDDYVQDNMYGHLYDLARTYSVEVVHADAVIVEGDTDKKNIRHIFSLHNKTRYFKKWGNVDLLTRHITDQSIWDGIYKREFLLQWRIRCNESHGAAFQDIGFLQQIHTFANNVVFSDQALYCYRADRPDSSTNTPGWLKYIRQEWKFIIGHEMCNLDEWIVHKSAVMTRLVTAFMCELRRSLIQSNYQYTHAEWYADYLWLREHTIQCVSDGMVIEAWLSVDERRKLWLLVNTENGFFDMLKLENCFPKYESDMLLHWADEPSVIFGCGALGKKVYDILLQSGRAVKGFVDNNSELWGTEYDGIKIYPPEDLNSCLNDFSVIVCNVYYSEEICSQLRRLGINEAKIHVYSPNGVR